MSEETKKLTLAEAAKQMLDKKKQAQAVNKGNHSSKFTPSGQPIMKSQYVKKTNNQRKKMGV